jgi:hypothetical protein
MGRRRAWHYRRRHHAALDPQAHRPLAMLKDQHVDVPMKKHDNIPL